MTTKQQDEALDYFRKHAGDWRLKADGMKAAEVNIIEQRNDYVRQVIGGRSSTKSFLDAGCGTGELVCAAAARGVNSTGVDYSPEMIDLAQKKAAAEKLSCAKFVCSSIFDFKLQRAGYDVISANGFIEYISLQQMEQFFDVVAEALAPGGSFVVGSRNRLFNLVSMNGFTLQEVEAGSVEMMIKEAVKWTTAKGMVEVTGAECGPYQAPETEHPVTGIKVATRFQYTPFQLIDLLQKRDLRAVEVYPVHIHGVTPAFASDNAPIHVSIANLLQPFGRHGTQLLAHASSFMLHVQKKD